MFRSDFRKKEICYKSDVWEHVFGMWMHFQISLSVWQYWESCRRSEICCCVRDIAEKSLNRLFWLLILKSSYRPSFKRICERLLLYLHVILLTMHEKDTVNKA